MNIHQRMLALADKIESRCLTAGESARLIRKELQVEEVEQLPVVELNGWMIVTGKTGWQRLAEKMYGIINWPNP